MVTIDLIETLMQTDTEPRGKQSEYLKKHYDESREELDIKILRKL